MKSSTAITANARTDYEAKLSAFVADEKAKLEKKPTGFFGNWAFHAAKKVEFERHLKNIPKNIL